MRKILLGLACVGFAACASSWDYDRRASQQEYRAALEKDQGDYQDAAMLESMARKNRNKAARLRVDEYYYYGYGYGVMPPAAYF